MQIITIHSRTAKTKRCYRCSKTKQIYKFVKRGKLRDGYGTLCVQCRNEYNKARYWADPVAAKARAAAAKKRWRSAMLEIVNTAKDVPCADCGGEFHRVAMDFHHVHGVKEANVSKICATYTPGSIEKLKCEIAKCVVLCACCHRLRHLAP